MRRAGCSRGSARERSSSAGAATKVTVTTMAPPPAPSWMNTSASRVSMLTFRVRCHCATHTCGRARCHCATHMNTHSATTLLPVRRRVVGAGRRHRPPQRWRALLHLSKPEEEFGKVQGLGVRKCVERRVSAFEGTPAHPVLMLTAAAGGLGGH